jgi:hypothetical protein
VSTDPNEPHPLPDVGSYRVIRDGDEQAVVVPMDDFLQLRAFELYADGETRELAEGVVRLMKWQAREEAGENVSFSIEEVRRQLGLEP